MKVGRAHFGNKLHSGRCGAVLTSVIRMEDPSTAHVPLCRRCFPHDLVKAQWRRQWLESMEA